MNQGNSSFVAVASNALNVQVSASVFALIYDSAARRSDCDELLQDVFSTVLSPPSQGQPDKIANGERSSILDHVWSSAHTVRFALKYPSAVRKVMIEYRPTSPLALFASRFLSATLKEESEPRDTSGRASLISSLISQCARHSPDGVDFKAFISEVGEVQALRYLASHPSSDVMRALSDLADLVEDPVSWSSGVLPQLTGQSPDSSKEDAYLVRFFLEAPGVPLEGWGSLPWAGLQLLPWSAHAMASAKMFEYAAKHLESEQARENFATLSDGWTGTIADLVTACNEV